MLAQLVWLATGRCFQRGAPPGTYTAPEYRIPCDCALQISGRDAAPALLFVLQFEESLGLICTNGVSMQWKWLDGFYGWLSTGIGWLLLPFISGHMLVVGVLLCTLGYY